MSEYWIVSAQQYERHRSLEEARAVRDNLARHFPERHFVIHRCKVSLHSAKHFPKLVELLRDIVEQGFTRENKDRASVLLTTIGNRNLMPVSPSAPPEWRPRPAEVA